MLEFLFVCLLAKHLINHHTYFNETFRNRLYVYNGFTFKAIPVQDTMANQILKSQKWLLLCSFTDIEPSLGFVVAERHPQHLLRALTYCTNCLSETLALTVGVNHICLLVKYFLY